MDWLGPYPFAASILLVLLVRWVFKKHEQSRRARFEGNPIVLARLSAGLAVAGVFAIAAVALAYYFDRLDADESFMYGFLVGGGALLMALIVLSHYIRERRRQSG